MYNKILICEDEENIVSFLTKELEFEGFASDTAYDGNTALKLFAENKYDLILLDVMLPKKNGLECLREFRKTSNIPIIILTARKEVYDKVAFLTAGADDYITKPFDTLELIARIKRNISRSLPVNKADEFIIVEKDSYRIFVNKHEISLTKTEFEIFNYLHENINKVKTRVEIINAVFGEFYGESNIIDSNVKNIRAKILPHSTTPIIETVRGKGYVIRND